MTSAQLRYVPLRPNLDLPLNPKLKSRFLRVSLRRTCLRQTSRSLTVGMTKFIVMRCDKRRSLG